MVTNPSRNSTEGRSLGAVIINLQRTPLDGAATLRVFGECDAVLAQLLAAHQMVAQLAELLLYTALLPGLSPPLPSLAELLRSRDRS